MYQKLIDQHRNDIRKKDAEILMLKRELYYYLTTNESETSIDSLTTEIGITQKQIEKIHFNHFLDIKALSKPQQLLKFNMLSEELIEIFNHKKHLKPQTK